MEGEEQTTEDQVVVEETNEPTVEEVNDAVVEDTTDVA